MNTSTSTRAQYLIRNQSGDAIVVDVVILDTRTVWNKEQYQIKPVSGYGTVWVQRSSLIMSTDNHGT